MGARLGSLARRRGRVLDGFDAVIVQHEFGLFGGADGEDIVELVARLERPVIVVLHTVLETPSPNQRRIVERLAAAAQQASSSRARSPASGCSRPTTSTRRA